jgi:hypothetical protein
MTPGHFQALEDQLDLMRWVGSKSGLAMIGALNKSQKKQGRHFHEHDEALAESLAEALNVASTFWVDEHSTGMIGTAAETVPYHPQLSIHDLPAEAGWVVFEHPFEIIDMHDKLMRIGALLWWKSSMVVHDAEGTTVHVPLVNMLWWSDPLDRKDAYSSDHIEKWGEDLLRSVTSGWVPSAWFFMPLDGEQAGELAAIEGVDSAVLSLQHGEDGWKEADCHRLSLAFWIFTTQVLHVTSHRPYRALQKRALKFGRIAEDIRVVTLRRKQYHSDEDPIETDVLWTHRWTVKGHWRRIHTNDGHTRLTYVRPHIKGPDHLPLILKDSIFKVTR